MNRALRPAVGFAAVPDTPPGLAPPAGGAGFRVVVTDEAAPTQLLRSPFPRVQLVNVGNAPCYLGGSSVTVGQGTYLPTGEPAQIAALDPSGLWAIPEPGGTIVEIQVLP